MIITSKILFYTSLEVEHDATRRLQLKLLFQLAYETLSSFSRKVIIEDHSITHSFPFQRSVVPSYQPILKTT